MSTPRNGSQNQRIAGLAGVDRGVPGWARRRSPCSHARPRPWRRPPSSSAWWSSAYRSRRKMRCAATRAHSMLLAKSMARLKTLTASGGLSGQVKLETALSKFRAAAADVAERTRCRGDHSGCEPGDARAGAEAALGARRSGERRRRAEARRHEPLSGALRAHRAAHPAGAERTGLGRERRGAHGAAARRQPRVPESGDARPVRRGVRLGADAGHRARTPSSG